MSGILRLDGQLVRLSANGVGVIDLTAPPPTLPGVVYFEPGEISGYEGQTIEELQGGAFKLRPGKQLSVEINVDDAGRYLSVSSVSVEG